jgi:hypothetical protein
MEFTYYLCDACQSKAMMMTSFSIGGEEPRHYCESCSVKIAQSIINMVEHLQAEQAGVTKGARAPTEGKV